MLPEERLLPLTGWNLKILDMDISERSGHPLPGFNLAKSTSDHPAARLLTAPILSSTPPVEALLAPTKDFHYTF